MRQSIIEYLHNAPILPQYIHKGPKKNKAPIIFVHGWAGFSRDNTPSTLYPYWGGMKVNIIDTLKAEGYDVYEASVGAMSSNHDRAVELYHYIKGGRVDYGAFHAHKFNHHRFGKTYTGVYPKWDENHGIHLIGHSMGGQTIRMLEDLLRRGRLNEQSYAKNHHQTCSTLFEGNHDGWIHSITTIGTPHNGTYVADKLGNKQMIKRFFFKIIEREGHKDKKVDWGFSQFGLRQQKDESYKAYLKRVKESALWHTNDNGFYDLTIQGAQKLNLFTDINPNIWYKSYTGVATHPPRIGKHPGMNLNMFPPFIFTGILNAYSGGTEWWENDGLVSAISSEHPINQPYAKDETIPFAQKGIWHVTPRRYQWDHVDQIGGNLENRRNTADQIMYFYRNIVEELVQLEKETHI